MLKNYLILKKITKSTRAERLSRLIRAFLTGKISPKELEKQLETLYNRHGDARTTLNQLVTHNSELVTSPDPLYHQIYQLITATHPLRTGLRDDQIESYANTVSARAATTERLTEYQNRGVKKVKVVAYIDAATTDICRSMHGRIFELPTPNSQLSTLNSQLVLPSSFWTDNHHFSQTPTAQMRPFLPPYHYNCRTRVVPYVEPADPYDAALDRYHNLAKLREADVQALVNKAISLEFATRSQLFDHLSKHKNDLGISTHKEYLNLVSALLKNPLKQMGLAISARDRSLNLYVWNPKVRMIGHLQKHDFAVFSLDKNTLKTFHPKTIGDIMKNLDPKVHAKVMLLTQQYTSKGANNMVGEIDVRQYEYILDYFANDDSCDELEMFSRLRFEQEWDSIPEPFKQRILAVDRIVLEKYADWFNYNVFNEYIACIKARLELEDGAAQ
jgi:SPP1 gp7 family putative phage head morphogenesis protein